ncbi:hypothetical protein AVEN_152660-1, partial [Araneus ventricosus]
GLENYWENGIQRNRGDSGIYCTGKDHHSSAVNLIPSNKECQGKDIHVLPQKFSKGI